MFYDKYQYSMEEHIVNTKKEKKKTLSLTPVENKDGLFVGIRSNGTKYSVRKDRHRTFFPDEWLMFISAVKPKNKFIFETLLATGARIDECLNIRVKDFSFDRNYIKLFVTKSKATKGEKKLFGGQQRSFVVSSQYIKKAKEYIKERNLNEDDYLFKVKMASVEDLLKRKLQLIGISDWYNFSLHNIRKTHGMWLKTLIPYSREITEGEICLRLGHDFNTFLKHYGSPSVFTEKDKAMMIKILGDIYNLK